jgi:RNA polymerase sigma factor (sigma-70 family)
MAFQCQEFRADESHPWQHLEPVLWVFFGASSVESRNAAALQIWAAAVHRAAAMLEMMQCANAKRDSEDIAQALLVRMLRRGLRGYDPAKGPLYAYWYTALRRQCIDFSRSTRSVEGFSQEPVDRRPGLAIVVAEQELQRVVRAAVNRLPKKERVPFKLSYRRGRSAKAIGKRCGLEPGTVNGRIHRGRNRLRAVLLRTFLAYVGDADVAERHDRARLPRHSAPQPRRKEGAK